jgi:hypothetical protein
LFLSPMRDNAISSDVAGRKPAPFAASAAPFAASVQQLTLGGPRKRFERSIAANQPLQFARPSGLGFGAFSPTSTLAVSCGSVGFAPFIAFALRVNRNSPCAPLLRHLSSSLERCASLRTRLACRSDAPHLPQRLRVQRSAAVASRLSDADLTVIKRHPPQGFRRVAAPLCPLGKPRLSRSAGALPQRLKAKQSTSN